MMFPTPVIANTAWPSSQLDRTGEFFLHGKQCHYLPIKGSLCFLYESPGRYFLSMCSQEPVINMNSASFIVPKHMLKRISDL